MRGETLARLVIGLTCAVALLGSAGAPHASRAAFGSPDAALRPAADGARIVFLPAVMRAYQGGAWPTATATATVTATAPATATPMPTATPSEVLPAPGHWEGTTNLGKPMGFEVSLDSSQWYSFTLTTTFSAPSCGVSSGTTTITVSGPGAIAHGQFSREGSFAFAGQFHSATTAAGTYDFINHRLAIGLPYPPWICWYTFNQSGTWTASKPSSP